MVGEHIFFVDFSAFELMPQKRVKAKVRALGLGKYAVGGRWNKIFGSAYLHLFRRKEQHAARSEPAHS